MLNKIMASQLAAALLLLPVAQADEHYNLDPAHTRIGFSVRHMGISNVKGVFDEFDGSIMLDDGKIKEASATIQVKSINTRIRQRDHHLLTADFFDVEKYPVITFKTKRVETVGGQTVLIGDFTMRGITKELTLPVRLSGPIKDPQGNTRMGLEAVTKLNRKDYGMPFKAALETGVSLVGEEVTIEINAEAVKETAGTAQKK